MILDVEYVDKSKEQIELTDTQFRVLFRDAEWHEKKIKRILFVKKDSDKGPDSIVFA